MCKHAGGCSHLATESAEALLELVAKRIHLIILHTEICTALVQHALIPASFGLGLLQLTTSALQSASNNQTNVCTCVDDSVS